MFGVPVIAGASLRIPIRTDMAPSTPDKGRAITYCASSSAHDQPFVILRDGVRQENLSSDISLVFLRDHKTLHHHRHDIAPDGMSGRKETRRPKDNVGSGQHFRPNHASARRFLILKLKSNF